MCVEEGGSKNCIKPMTGGQKQMHSHLELYAIASAALKHDADKIRCRYSVSKVTRISLPACGRQAVWVLTLEHCAAVLLREHYSIAATGTGGQSRHVGLSDLLLLHPALHGPVQAGG